MSFETGIGIIRFMSESPIFKGSSLIVLAIIAFAFAFLRKEDAQRHGAAYWMFVVVTAIILIYGIFILAVQPQWWKTLV